MKNITLVLLCCSAFLYACDSADDAGRAADADKEKVMHKSAAENDSSADTDDASSGVSAKASDVVVLEGAVDVKQGESIYKSKCAACHNTGAAGAPKLGDKAAWRARIAQGDAALVLHAIEGYKGDTGYMPPKGGFLGLSDEEISITVQYMVSQSQ